MFFRNPDSADSDTDLPDAAFHEASTQKMDTSPTNELDMKMDRMMALVEDMSKRMREQEEMLQEQDRLIASLQGEKNTECRNKKPRSSLEPMDVDFSLSSPQHFHHRTGELSKFNGERAGWISWRTEAQTKLRIDGRAIGTEEEQFGYLYMHLTTTAQKRIQQWYNMRLKLGTGCTPIAFLERAEGTFGDPNERKNAHTLLMVIKQKDNESFSEFITGFEELLAQAGGDDWPMEVQVNTLERAVNKEMQSRLVSYPLSDESYFTFRAACLTIDAKLQAMRTWNNSSSSGAVSGKSGSGSANSKMNVPVSKNSGASVGNYNNTGERARWVSTEERERRRQAGVCLRCGRNNHILKECRFRRAVEPQIRSNDLKINEVDVGGNIENTSDNKGNV